MRKMAIKAGIRRSKAAVVQPKGSSYAGKAAKRQASLSAPVAASRISPINGRMSGKIVRGTKDCNPFRADKELSRRIR